MGLQQIWLGKKKTNLVVKKELLFGDENSISNFWNWNSWGLPPFYLIELRWQQKCIEFFELCCCSPLIRGSLPSIWVFPTKNHHRRRRSSFSIFLQQQSSAALLVHFSKDSIKKYNLQVVIINRLNFQKFRNQFLTRSKNFRMKLQMNSQRN